MPRIEYKSYDFKKPPLLSEQNYVFLKDILLQNPHQSLNPKSSIREEFHYEIILYSSIIGSLSLGMILMNATIIEWIKIIGGIILVIGLFLGLYGTLHFYGFYITVLSFLRFLVIKWNYYRVLKNDIIKTADYQEFLIKRKKRW
jgi:hypothetical protein